MAAKKPASGKKVFTATSTSEKQQNINTRTGTADMRSKAKPAPKPAKPIIGRTSQDPKVKAQINEKVKKTPNIKISGSASTVSNKKPSMVDSGSRKVTSGKKSGLAARVGTVAREAKDVVKAVGTAANVAKISAQSRNVSPQAVKGAAKNLVKQVKETGRAAVTGKSGTTSATAGTAYKSNPARTRNNAPITAKFVASNAYIKPGKKRK